MGVQHGLGVIQCGLDVVEEVWGVLNWCNIWAFRGVFDVVWGVFEVVWGYI